MLSNYKNLRSLCSASIKRFRSTKKAGVLVIHNNRHSTCFHDLRPFVPGDHRGEALQVIFTEGHHVSIKNVVKAWRRGHGALTR